MLIKNIVFDMGNVLTDYDGSRVCRHYLADEEDAKRVEAALFTSPEWLLLDLGVISDEEAMERILPRLPKRLHEVAALCMSDWHIYNLEPSAEMEQVVRDLKRRGYGLYVCSNAAIRLLSCYREAIPTHSLFDGMIFSAEIQYIKPQKEIYLELFRRFHLQPQECFFIDDLAVNIAGAARVGMEGYWYKDRDVQKLRKVLEELG